MEAKFQYDSLNKEEVYREQTSLIKNINTILSSDIFSNFVPNYKTLASIQSIFNKQNSPKNRVLLEEKLVEFLTSDKKEESFNIKDPIDNLVYKSFVKKFNDKYNKSLTENQKNLLTKYVTSFVDEGMELKIFLNEEIGELKTKIKTLLETDFVSNNSEIKEKTSLVLEKLESFKQKGIDDILIMDVLRVQSLISEMEKDGD
jgi:ribosomal protein S20